MKFSCALQLMLVVTCAEAWSPSCNNQKSTLRQSVKMHENYNGYLFAPVQNDLTLHSFPSQSSRCFDNSRGTIKNLLFTALALKVLFPWIKNKNESCKNFTANIDTFSRTIEPSTEVTAMTQSHLSTAESKKACTIETRCAEQLTEYKITPQIQNLAPTVVPAAPLAQFTPAVTNENGFELTVPLKITVLSKGIIIPTCSLLSLSTCIFLILLDSSPFCCDET